MRCSLSTSSMPRVAWMEPMTMAVGFFLPRSSSLVACTPNIRVGSPSISMACPRSMPISAKARWKPASREAPVERMSWPPI
ncbi:hypothetical protein D9M68_934390 [compost metagenome]